jgi:hypothetical protein
MSTEKKTINEVMDAMPEQWRHRWCGGGICGCLGCSNRSGGLLSHGFTQKDWEDWKAETGFVDPIQEEPDFSKLIAHLQSARVKRVTLEDPPEFIVQGATSVPVIREKRVGAEFTEASKEEPLHSCEDPPEYILPFAHAIPVIRERRIQAEFYELTEKDKPA